jgi:hypothetical protein
MRKATICLVVFLCSWAAFGQDKVPQWKVVRDVVLTKQTSPISQTTVFTPTSPGLYRLSSYLSVSGAGASWGLSVYWTDLTGALTSSTFGTGPGWAWSGPIIFSIEPGQSFSYSVSGTGGGTYNVGFTVERLQVD